MVERLADKKLRILKALLQEKSGEFVEERKNYRFLDTAHLQIPLETLTNILGEFQMKRLINVGSSHNIPLYNEVGDPTDVYTDDYLVEVEITNEKELEVLLEECKNQFPKRKKPIIREKTLELIGKDIGELDSAVNLIKLLKDCGVDEELIIYPNTKWRMIRDAIVYLAYSRKKEDEQALFKVIGEATHPLTHNGNTISAEALREKFNHFLSYNGLGIGYDEDEAIYGVGRLTSEEDEENQFLSEKAEEAIEAMEFEARDKKELESLCRPENKERISLLRKAYQQLMSVVEVFCENPSNPTSELNDTYKYLNRLVWDNIQALHLRGDAIRNLNNYTSPFVNLFAAEKHYRQRKKELSWESIRPEMNAMFGDIEELYREVNGSDVLAEPDTQKKLNEIQLYLSTLKEKTKRDEKKEIIKESSAAKIQIIRMPPLEFKELKAKRIISKVSLKSAKIIYNDDEALIKINGRGVALPPYKNEHYLCRVMFKHPVGEFVSWDIIYREMTGVEFPPPEKWRTVYDTMGALNNRIKDVIKTDDEFFTWAEKTVKRNYEI